MMTGQALPIFFNMVAGEDYWCWGVLGCKLYAVHGAIVGTSSIWTMVVIGFDRCISEYYPLVDFTPQHWLPLLGLNLLLNLCVQMECHCQGIQRNKDHSWKSSWFHICLLDLCYRHRNASIYWMGKIRSW